MTNTKTQLDVLFHSGLAEREFGNSLLSVAKLLAWVKTRDLELATEPPLSGFRFVQVEMLLCAIERSVGNSLTPEQAFELVAGDPNLSKERAAKDPITCRWLLGADAHLQWRKQIEKAVAAQELFLLDFGSKLPIGKPQQAAPVAPAAQATEPASEPPEWEQMAVTRAVEIIANDKKKDLYPSQIVIADTIAKEFRAAGMVGAGGKPLTGAYIKRHALKGISSEQGRQLSTATRRGK
jgi:hypothetical protein